MPWIVPLIMSLASTAVGGVNSIINNNKQRRFQEQQLAKEQQLNDEINTNNKLTALNNQMNENSQFSTEYASNLNRGTSTGLLSNQMPVGTTIGVQDLNNIGYLNRDRDTNNLYFDRIEYAKCGGKFKRK